MKRTTTLITLILTAFAAYWSIKSAMPDYQSDSDITKEEFSVDRALKHVQKISQKPHAVGFEAHTAAREYIISELENIGLKVETQEGYTVGDWANYSKAVNILARIKGSGNGPALLLLSHYDSNPHSALGASDAASGVATILEGIRAYMAQGQSPKNDIIILITDAEELGLNGADLFVNKHPWSKDVGLALNFEARGSGGPSYMLLETNGGNSALIEAFRAADPKYPVGNSLAYSIYKMLPNDTDLTVFREDGDINGFNFAFIDDHFDYHTARDNYERLDRNSLAHQGTYLTALLPYFAESDLEQLSAPSDDIFFNVPLFKLVSYPYTWGWYLLGAALLIFILLIIRGLRRESISMQNAFIGFAPLLLTLLINGIIGYYGWSLIKKIYPHYQDILHGFTYNGHAYIIAFVFLTLCVCLFVYHRFRNYSVTELLLAPILLWLVICTLITLYLPGAGFMIIPVFAALVSLLVLVNQKDPNPYLLWFLLLPAVCLYAPFIKMFPVGLGLNMMVTVTVLTTLTFFLAIPLVGQYRSKKKLGLVLMVLSVFFLVFAHTRSGFTEERAKPTSLVYMLDTKTNESFWATYEREPSAWTSQYVNKESKAEETIATRVISSKYRTPFSYLAKAPSKEILPPTILTERDTVIGEDRSVLIRINPNRQVNRLDIFTEATSFSGVAVNSLPLPEEFLNRRRGGKLLTHYISNNENTELHLTLPRDSTFTLLLYESSNDLLHHELFSIPPRPNDNIPMPFVLNDAIMTVSTWEIR